LTCEGCKEPFQCDVSWIISILIYRRSRYDDIGVKTGAAV
jgi:hypothetical protein